MFFFNAHYQKMFYSELNIFLLFRLDLCRQTSVSKRGMREPAILSTAHIGNQFTFMTLSPWMLSVDQKHVQKRPMKILRSIQHCTINVRGMSTIEHSHQWTKTTETMRTPMKPVSDSILLCKKHIRLLRPLHPRQFNEIPQTFITLWII